MFKRAVTVAPLRRLHRDIPRPGVILQFPHINLAPPPVQPQRHAPKRRIPRWVALAINFGVTLSLVELPIQCYNYVFEPLAPVQRLIASVPDLSALQSDALAEHLEELLVAIVPSKPDDRLEIRRAIAQASSELQMIICEEIHHNGRPKTFFVLESVLGLIVTRFFFLATMSRRTPILDSPFSNPLEEQPEDYNNDLARPGLK
ncbi:hypothetical protein C8R46DRAFT_1211026 [Mycena filopes]|nr:hypothetical protein C8R46DRAFT_1211026 [Mycena filopes]